MPLIQQNIRQHKTSLLIRLIHLQRPLTVLRARLIITLRLVQMSQRKQSTDMAVILRQALQVNLNRRSRIRLSLLQVLAKLEINLSSYCSLLIHSIALHLSALLNDLRLRVPRFFQGAEGVLVGFELPVALLDVFFEEDFGHEEEVVDFLGFGVCLILVEALEVLHGVDKNLLGFVKVLEFDVKFG